MNDRIKTMIPTLNLQSYSYLNSNQSANLEALCSQHILVNSLTPGISSPDINWMAQLCPLVLGEAVYQARALAEKFAENIVYDDDSLCLARGILRQGKGLQNKELAEAFLSPNPSNETVTISLSSLDIEVEDVFIFSATGGLIKPVEVDRGKRIEQLSTAELSDGIYTLKLELSNGRSITKKLCVIH